MTDTTGAAFSWEEIASDWLVEDVKLFEASAWIKPLNVPYVTSSNRNIIGKAVAMEAV